MTVSALDRRVAARLDDVVAEMDFADPVSLHEEVAASSMRRRRGFVARDYNGLATLSLVRDDGLLRWIYQPPVRSPAARRVRRATMRAVGAEPLREFSFRETKPNEVIAALDRLDSKLTPKRGLRRYTQNGTFEQADGIKVDGPVLLLVHGTFSKSEMFIEELGAIDEGTEFLRKAAGGRYKAVLSFEHPTLSVSPWINALDLEAALVGVSGEIDVVCHSRGGLVVAWWLRNASRKVRNVIFVGAPLEGTSLASPANLRSALQGLANVFSGLEAVSAPLSTIVPLMSAVTGLSAIFGGILQLGARTPLADATIVIVPGLAGQSRVGNNAELDRLNRSKWISSPRFHFVISNFEPKEEDAAWWQVWKFFRNPRDRLLNLGADAIFQDDNDLVVNTGSMTRLFGSTVTGKNVCDFRTSDKVHHCNYFRQRETVRFFRAALEF